MENDEPKELSYTYGGVLMTFMSDSFAYPVKTVKRMVHVCEGPNTSGDAFRVGELLPVLVPESVVEEFDAGCPVGPLTVMALANGTAVNVSRGQVLPVDRVNVDQEGTGLYKDGFPVFHRDRLKEKWLHRVLPYQRRWR